MIIPSYAVFWAKQTTNDVPSLLQDTIQTSFSNSGSGTVDQSVALTGSAGTEKVWSPCTGSDGYTGILNINFRSALVGDGNASFKTSTEEWDLVWRRC